MKKLFIFLVIFVIALSVSIVSSESTNELNIGSFTKFIPYIEEVPEEIKPTSVSFVGDVFLGRRVETYLNTYGSNYVYSSLPQVSSSTVLVGNFEASIPEVHVQTPEMTFSFSVDERHINALSEYGFTYFGLANNHSYDKGSADFENTQNVLSHYNITPFGNPESFASTTIRYIEIDEAVIALVGVHAVVQPPTETDLQLVLAEAVVKSDFQIAYVHWGTEYVSDHSLEQQTLGHLLVDVGFDAVIGHHPHVVQDVELYKDVPIFYSLGNFIFDQYFSKEVQEGLWVTVGVNESKLSYSLKGITSLGSRSVPRFMSSYENDLLLRNIAEKSSSVLYESITNGYIKP